MDRDKDPGTDQIGTDHRTLRTDHVCTDRHGVAAGTRVGRKGRHDRHPETG